MSFARSSRGQRLIASARQKYDTPQNRQRASEGVNRLRQQVQQAASRKRAA